jgi:hypothetical protein
VANGRALDLTLIRVNSRMPTPYVRVPVERKQCLNPNCREWFDGKPSQLYHSSACQRAVNSAKRGNRGYRKIIDDNSYCAWCGPTIHYERVQLDVHHLDGNRENNDPSNLEIFCSNCHRVAESQKRIRESRSLPPLGSQMPRVLLRKQPHVNPYAHPTWRKEPEHESTLESGKQWVNPDELGEDELSDNPYVQDLIQGFQDSIWQASCAARDSARRMGKMARSFRNRFQKEV